MKQKIAIHWFRQDLRLADNPSLTEAAKHRAILPIYIWDDVNAKDCKMGSASRVWLESSLKALNASLDNKLNFYQGHPLDVLLFIIERFEVEAIYWNRCYEPWQLERDLKIKQTLKKQNIKVISFNASLLWEPWQINKEGGSPYKVFTPFYRKGCLNAPEPRLPLPAPKNAKYINDPTHLGIKKLPLSQNKAWEKKITSHWDISENGAHKQFHAFIETGLFDYKEGRNFPAQPRVSRLSPYLHFGEISVNHLWYSVKQIGDDKNIDHFCSELGWREFSYHLLYHNPTLKHKNLQSKFDRFPWIKNDQHLEAWQQGKTGIPMVDAGIRELWQTGYVHNRVRMILGSFLVKNLRLHWHHGERWFWDTLVDADLANNSASWQWIAGCGADAAPYFRIFNPVTQGQKFDPKGEYIRRYLPELGLLPDKYLFSPWEAPKEVLAKANITLGVQYPEPIVNLKISRETALEAFKSLKND